MSRGVGVAAPEKEGSSVRVAAGPDSSSAAAASLAKPVLTTYIARPRDGDAV